MSDISKDLNKLLDSPLFEKDKKDTGDDTTVKKLTTPTQDLKPSDTQRIKDWLAKQS